MDNPVSGRFLSDALLHQGLLTAKEFHGQLVVRWLEESLKLIADERWLGFAAHVGWTRARSGFFFGRPIKADIVTASCTVAEMNSASTGDIAAAGRTTPSSAGHIIFIDKVHIVSDEIVRHEGRRGRFVFQGRH